MKIHRYFKNSDFSLRKFDQFVEWLIIFGLISFILLVCCSCGTTRTVPIETIKEVTKIDTLYLNTFRFDSTYISHDFLTDRSRDTILIRKTNTEIRHKILRDTVERVKIEIQRDSIPYEVRIETIKEVPRKRYWFDILSYICFGICSAGLFITIFCLQKGRRR